MSSGLVLNTNINSLVAQNALTSSGTQLASALEQLSTGLRINTAADDAAGYAIVNGMTSQINGLNQAAENANDGVSLAQTASGALSEVVNDLQSMRDLAVESLNATNSSADRVDLDAQFQQLKADIDNVAGTTQFNGVNLLDGSFQGATFQIGANAGQTITVSSVASAASDNLGQLYTAAATDPASYTSDGTAGGTAVASGDSGAFTLSVGGQTYTTSAVTLTGTQSTDLKTIAAAITQATGDAGVVATIDANGTGIDLSSTTQQTVSLSYTPTSGSTGAETLATFGLAASNVLAAPATTYGSAGGTYSNADVAAGDTGVITIAGTATASFAITGTQATDLNNAIAAINGVSTTTGVTAALDTAGTGIALSSPTSQTVALSLAVTGTGTETITALGLTASEAITTAASTGETPTTLATANVQTVDSSNEVLIQVDAALQQLATTGADLGAYQDRFQAAVTGLNTDSTNLSSAKSQIQDTDYAAATTTLTQAQILQQAGTAMVAQANTIPQNVLTLLNKLS